MELRQFGGGGFDEGVDLADELLICRELFHSFQRLEIELARAVLGVVAVALIFCACHLLGFGEEDTVAGQIFGC